MFTFSFLRRMTKKNVNKIMLPLLSCKLCNNITIFLKVSITLLKCVQISSYISIHRKNLTPDTRFFIKRLCDFSNQQSSTWQKKESTFSKVTAHKLKLLFFKNNDKLFFKLFPCLRDRSSGLNTRGPDNQARIMPVSVAFTQPASRTHMHTQFGLLIMVLLKQIVTFLPILY